MKLSEIWNIHHDLTVSASNIARQLGFAGIAICYLFKSEPLEFPRIILISLSFFIAYFIFDLFQFTVTSVKYHKYAIDRERELQRRDKDLEKAEVEPYPRNLNNFPFIFFYSKFVFLFIGFLVLGYQIYLKTNI